MSGLADALGLIRKRYLCLQLSSLHPGFLGNPLNCMYMVLEVGLQNVECCAFVQE